MSENKPIAHDAHREAWASFSGSSEAVPARPHRVVSPTSAASRTGRPSRPAVRSLPAEIEHAPSPSSNSLEKTSRIGFHPREEYVRPLIEAVAAYNGQTTSDYMREAVLEHARRTVEEQGPEKILETLDTKIQEEHEKAMEKARVALAETDEK